MAQEKEPKGITRRQFLKGITALGASALLSSCGVEEEPVSPKPTETLSPTETTPPTKVPTQGSSPTSQSTLTPESTPAPEITRITSLTITADYLKNAFAGIGGEEVITNGQKEVSMVQFGQEYVSQSWGEEINFTNLPQSPINSLKYLVSLGAYQGQEGVYSPGKQGEEVIFPQLATLSLARLALKSVPSEMEQKEQDYREWISPLNLTLRPQTQMTVIGLLNEPRPGAEVTVDKEAPGGELNYALVAFTDYFRTSEEGIPRHYLAVIPAHFPADPENKNALPLQNLLEANGYQYDSQSKEIAVVGQDNQKTILGLNQIEGEELTKDLRQATGLAFVDQMKGELIKNPLVPYYEEMPAIWEIKEEADEDGTISLLLQGQDEKGEMVAVAKASYDQEKEVWGWEKIEPKPEISLEEIMAIEGLEARWNGEINRWEYFDPQDNCLVGYWNAEEKRFELTADELRGEWKGLYVDANDEAIEEVKNALDQGTIKWLIDSAIMENGGRIKETVNKVGGDSSLFVYNLPPGVKLKLPFDAHLEWYGGTFFGESFRAVAIKPDFKSVLGIHFDLMHPDDVPTERSFAGSKGITLWTSSNHFIDPRIGIGIKERDSGQDFSRDFLSELQLGLRMKEDVITSHSFPLASLVKDEKGRFYCFK